MNNQTDIWGVEKKSIIDYFNDASMMLCWSAVGVLLAFIVKKIYN